MLKEKIQHMTVFDAFRIWIGVVVLGIFTLPFSWFFAPAIIFAGTSLLVAYYMHAKREDEKVLAAEAELQARVKELASEKTDMVRPLAHKVGRVRLELDRFAKDTFGPNGHWFLKSGKKLFDVLAMSDDFTVFMYGQNGMREVDCSIADGKVYFVVKPVEKPAAKTAEQPVEKPAEDTPERKAASAQFWAEKFVSRVQNAIDASKSELVLTEGDYPLYLSAQVAADALVQVCGMEAEVQGDQITLYLKAETEEIVQDDDIPLPPPPPEEELGLPDFETA